MKFLAVLLTCCIPHKRLRKRLRADLTNRFLSAQVRRKAKSVGRGLHVWAPSTVTSRTVIGDAVTLNGVEIHGSGAATIGSYVHIGIDTLIMTQNHNFKDAELLPYDHTFVARAVSIGDCVWIGARVTILPGAEIGEGAIIQAGSVVHGKIPACSIAGGNPAKVFATRDLAHYERLKSEGKFRVR